MRATQTKLHKRRFSQEHCIKHKLFITFHQTLFRAANFHALIYAKDQTVFNTIPSSEGAYETVHVHILAITLTATCNTEIGSDFFIPVALIFRCSDGPYEIVHAGIFARTLTSTK